MIILLSFVMCFRSIGRFYVNNVYICTSITNIVYMSDRQQFIIDCTSLIPVIGTLVLIKIANEQMVTMVAAYVLCGELLGVLIRGQCKNLRGKFINCYLCLQIHSLWS